MSNTQSFAIVLAILTCPMAGAAVHYGRLKPGGSDPTLRRIFYMLPFVAAALALALAYGALHLPA
jgi:hypothetical protein